MNKNHKKKVYIELLAIIANSGVGIKIDHIRQINNDLIPYVEKLIEENKFYVYNDSIYVPNTYCVGEDDDNRVDNMAHPFLQCYMGHGEDRFIMDKTNQWVKDNYPDEYIAWEKENEEQLENLLALRKEVEKNNSFLKKMKSNFYNWLKQ